MLAKQDIKWFELFFDIIFVVGIAKIVDELSANINEVTIDGVIRSMILLFILFNVWIKVTMLENKIKVVERYLQKKLQSPNYKVPVFIQFILTLCLIYFYSFQYDQTNTIAFIIIFFLLTLSNGLLYVFKPLKAVYVFIIATLALFKVDYHILLGLFSLYIIYETIYTYKNLRTISNLIFKSSKFRPSIESEFTEVDHSIFEYSNFRRKMYVPHLIERLGIIMIVFLAEYIIISLNTLNYSKTIIEFLINGTLIFSLVIMFYYNYYSSIEHIDEKLMEYNDKRKKYIRGKKSLYIIMLYFLSISCFAFYVKNLKGDIGNLTEIIGIAGYVIFEITDVILFKMYDDIKKGKWFLYLSSKIIGTILLIVSVILADPLIVLLCIDLCFVMNIIVGKKLTTVEYSIH